MNPMTTAIHFACGGCGRESFGVLALYRNGQVSVPLAYGDEWLPTPPTFQRSLTDNTLLMAWQCENCTPDDGTMHYTVIGDAPLQPVGEATDPETGEITQFYQLPPAAVVLHR